MPIEESLILKLEKLAKLKMDAKERAKIGDDLGEILKMVEKLDSLDTSGVAPLVYMSTEINRLREDKIENQIETQSALANAPQKDGRFFTVPKVVKK